jgi:hypothetical protein
MYGQKKSVNILKDDKRIHHHPIDFSTAGTGLRYKLNTLNFDQYLHTYHSRFIPEGVTEVSQIFYQN